MKANRAFRKKMADDMAAGNAYGIGAIVLGLVLLIIGAVVGLKVLASLMPSFTESVASISENFTTADWGDETANSISPIFGMVVGILGLLSFLGLALYVVRTRKGGA